MRRASVVRVASVHACARDDHSVIAWRIEYHVAEDLQPLREAMIEEGPEAFYVAIVRHRLKGDNVAAECKRKERVPSKICANVDHETACSAASLCDVFPERCQRRLNNQPPSNV